MSFLDRTKLVAAVVVVALVLVVLWQWPVSAALTGWAVLLYVLLRAAPAIRSDFGRLHRRFFPANEWRF